MRVLVACEFSGRVREAFRKRGHDAWSCDLLPTEIPGQHYQSDALDVAYSYDWDLMIAHPPCTYLTNAGVRHLHENVASRNGVRAKVYGKARMEAMKDGAAFFKGLKDAPIPKIVVENPIPHKYAKEIIGAYTQLIQPWMFGDKKTKATCLWLKGLPKLIPTKIVGPMPKNVTQIEKRSWHECHYTSPGVNRAKSRSVTYQGIADALAEQYGNDYVYVEQQ